MFIERRMKKGVFVKNRCQSVRAFGVSMCMVAVSLTCQALTDVTCKASGQDGKIPSQSGYSPFVDRTFWPDGADPLSSDAQNYNFILKTVCRSPESSNWANFAYSKNGVSVAKGSYDGVFKGGALSLYKQIYLKMATDSAKLTVDNFRCYDGAVLNYMSGGTSYLCGHIYLDGNFPSSAPLSVLFNDNTKIDLRTLCVQSKLHGADTKHVKVYFSVKQGETGLGIMRLLLDADNSETFTGKLIAGYNGILAFSSANAIGGPLASFSEKAITLCDGGALSCATEGVVLPASHNRGVYVEETGGQLDAAVDWTLAYPVSGPGDVKKTGPGTLTLAGEFSANSLSVSEGALALAEGVEVENLKFAGGGLKLVQNGQPIAVGGSFSVSQPVTLEIVSIPPGLSATESVTYPALLIASGAGVVRAGDFVIAGGNGTERVCVTEKTDGSHLVSVTLNGYVQGSAVSSPSKTLFNNSAMWSDNNPIDSANHYLINANSIFRTGTEESVYEFAGKSFSFNGLTFEQKPRVFVAQDMRVHGGTYRFTGSSAPAAEDCPVEMMALRGDIWIAVGNSSKWLLRPYNNGICRIDARLSGYGQLEYTGVTDATNATYRLTADNSGFVGKMKVYGNTPKQGSTDKATVITFQVGDKSNLGGNPLAFCSDGVSLGTNAVFQPLADVVFDDLNRGWTCGNCGCVDVPDGLSMTTKSTLTFEKGRFRKSGGGRWRVAGAAVRAADDVRFEIAGGVVEGANARALSEIPVTLLAAGGLALMFPDDAQDARRQYGLLMLSGVDVSDASCRFELDLESAPTTKDETLVPLLTAPVADAELFASRAKVTLKGAPEHRAKVLSCSDPFVVDGIECKTVFACVQGKPGLLLFLK